MREWSITTDGPLSLRIAADARLTIPDYLDDQIWELTLEGGDPPALAMQTTYGLRARSMRIFPGFSRGEASVTNPAHFASLPKLLAFLPNYLRVSFNPFHDLEVLAEYWVEESHVLAGRFVLRNIGLEEQRVRLRLHAVLRPGDNPQAMGEVAYAGANALAGRTGNLEPVVFLSGGATVEQAAYPALVATQLLPSGANKSWSWGHAGLADQKASFDLARSLVAHNWDAEIARLEMLAASQVDIQTGEPDWDAGLALGQKVALGSFVGPTRHLPATSFVLNRLPDRGYSDRGDGKDYNLHWDGQMAVHAYVNLTNILPAAPDLATGVFRNFLSVQEPDGTIDWKPGLAGQRNGALSIPLLATLAWRIYQHTQDREFLVSSFPRLLEFFNTWFAKSHDRDQDGHPEWDHTAHAAFDNAPSFVRWHRWGQGLDISKAETIDLAAYLFREARSLMAIAEVLDEAEAVPTIQSRLERLREALQVSWDDATASYHHLDRDVHVSVPGEFLGKGRGQFTLDVRRTFDSPVRVLIRSNGEEGLSHAIKVFIHGRGRRNQQRVERLNERRFQWFWEFGTSTSDKTYTEIERIEVTGLSDEFVTELWIADYTRQDLTLLLPLWAGIPTPERAERIVQETLLDPKRYWRPFGLPNCSAQDPAYSSDNRQGAGGVWMVWNTMLCEALVDYGFLDEAADLVRRLMEASLNSLRTDKSFREFYNADEPEGLGERDHVCGVAPVGAFLYTLGVRLISPHKAWLRNRNPFPWPVIIRWRGMELECLKDRTKVRFPNGQQVEVRGDRPQIVEQFL
jgi:hypothetical protein